MPRGHATGQTGPKRTRTEREAALAEIARLDTLGLNQFQIADQLVELGHKRVSQVQISKDLKTIRQRHLATQVEERQTKVDALVRFYQRVRQEAVVAWEDSKCAIRKIKVKDGAIKEIKIRVNPIGRFLLVAIKAMDGEIELLGLVPPKKVDVRQSTLDWEQLAAAIPDDVPDEIEAMLEAPKLRT
jgi:hypothetical protein